MKIPPKQNATYKICEALYRHGMSVTLDEGIALHGYTGAPKYSIMLNLYTSMCDTGYITEVDGVYSLASHMQRYFDGCEKKEVVRVATHNVLPKYVRPFRPMPVQPRDPRLSSTAYRTSGTSEEKKINGVKI